MRFSAWIAMMAAAALPGMAWAQMGPSEGGRAAYARFKSLDRDGDRALSRAELRAVGRARGAGSLFLMLDSDNDGRLNLAELESVGGGGLGRMQAYDADRDGYVSRREFPAFVDPYLVKALDADDDRRLTLGEIRPAFAGWRPRAETSPSPEREPRPQARRPAWCWVPAIGDDGWGLEAPVLWGPCRLTGGRP